MVHQKILCNFRIQEVLIEFNPKSPGGGRILPGGQEIACLFSLDHAMVTKFLDFVHKHLKYKVVKSFFTILTGFPEIQPRPSRDHEFLGSKITKLIFFNFLITKSSNFISNLNEDCSQLSFEVYNVCVAQKLQISEF